MDLQYKLLARFIIPSTSENVTLLPRANLWPNSIDNSLFRKSFQGKIIISAITQSVTVIFGMSAPYNRLWVYI